MGEDLPAVVLEEEAGAAGEMVFIRPKIFSSNTWSILARLKATHRMMVSAQRAARPF